MQWLELNIEDGLALLAMNHEPENRMSGPFGQEVRTCLDELTKNDAVKSVVIIGKPEKYFCNGLDLTWMMQQSAETLYEFLMDLSRLLKDTALFSKPLIGAINGHAFGLGAIWASGFDFRIMREDRGWVCFPEMDINIAFMPGMIAICEHGLGKPTFREMAWTAKRYTGPEAVAVGWAREAVPKDQLLPKALELAAFMAKKAQPAFSETKKRWARELARVFDELDPEAIKTAPILKK